MATPRTVPTHPTTPSLLQSHPKGGDPRRRGPWQGILAGDAERSLAVAKVLRCSQGTSTSSRSFLAPCSSLLTGRRGPPCSLAPPRGPSSAAALWRRRPPHRPATICDAAGTSRLPTLRSVEWSCARPPGRPRRRRAPSPEPPPLCPT